MDEKERVTRKMKDLKRFADFLKSKQSVTTEDLANDYVLRSAVERNLQLALECALEIGEIIISKEGLRKPEKYKEIIEILGQGKVLPKSFVKKFAPAAGLRNILVHHYAEVDLKELYRNLQEDIGDFDAFARYVAKHVKKWK